MTSLILPQRTLSARVNTANPSSRQASAPRTGAPGSVSAQPVGYQGLSSFDGARLQGPSANLSGLEHVLSMLGELVSSLKGDGAQGEYPAPDPYDLGDGYAYAPGFPSPEAPPYEEPPATPYPPEAPPQAPPYAPATPHKQPPKRGNERHERHEQRHERHEQRHEQRHERKVQHHKQAKQGRPDLPTPGPAGKPKVDDDSKKENGVLSGTGLSPLIFDLSGTGLKVREGKRIALDFDGDGVLEAITDLDRGMGLLVFDPRSDEEGFGCRTFGDYTDLSAYGIEGPEQGGHFANGFDALRALCEHYELIHERKQHLDAGDLAFLEEEVGLRMRVDGLLGSDDRRFADLGISRISIGDARRIQSLRAAEVDGYGNQLMRQSGATFVLNGVTREYLDIWFNIQARIQPEAERAGLATSCTFQG
jgi:hypothetical protein